MGGMGSVRGGNTKCIVFGDLLSDMHSCVHIYCLIIKYSSIRFIMKNK